jgi:hypothetical protein
VRSSPAMRVLQLCSKPPWPPIDGGTKAMHNITRGLLQAGHEVKVLSVSTRKHPLRVGKVPRGIPGGHAPGRGVRGHLASTWWTPSRTW